MRQVWVWPGEVLVRWVELGVCLIRWVQFGVFIIGAIIGCLRREGLARCSPHPVGRVRCLSQPVVSGRVKSSIAGCPPQQAAEPVEITVGRVGPVFVMAAQGPCVILQHPDLGADDTFLVKEIPGVVVVVVGEEAPEEAGEELLHASLLLLEHLGQSIAVCLLLLLEAERAVPAVPEHLVHVERRLPVLSQGLGRLALVLAQVRCVLVLRQAGELSEAVRSADS